MQVMVKTSKPSKQRKRLFQAPDHIRYKHFAAPLSPELRKAHGMRNLPVRTGDIVRVMRGDRKGFEGRVFSVDRKKFHVYIEGLTREKVDGTTVFVPVHPSKVMITKLNLDDKWRKRILERRKKAKEAIEAVEKAIEKAVEVEEKAAAVTEGPQPFVGKAKPRRKKKAEKKTEEKVKTKKGKSSEESKVG